MSSAQAKPLSSAQVKPLTKQIENWHCADMVLRGSNFAEPGWWRGVGVGSLRWEGHWLLEVWGVIPEANFLFKLLDLSYLEIVHMPCGIAAKYQEPALRFHDCVVQEKWSNDLVTFGGVDDAMLHVQFRVGKLEVLHGGGAQAWRDLMAQVEK